MITTEQLLDALHEQTHHDEVERLNTLMSQFNQPLYPTV